MARSKRGHSWYQSHSHDLYVRQAREQGWRSRAVYKLEDLDVRDHLLTAGMTVLELGAAPGGWSQYASRRVGDRGRIITVDVLPMQLINNVEFVQGDFREEGVLRQLLERLGPTRADLVMSDMSPNISGVMTVDQPRAMELAELSLQLARETLKPGGDFLVKLFQGDGFDQFLQAVRTRFRKAVVRKPPASRSHSREVYLVAKNYTL